MVFHWAAVRSLGYLSGWRHRLRVHGTEAAPLKVYGRGGSSPPFYTKQDPGFSGVLAAGLATELVEAGAGAASCFRTAGPGVASSDLKGMDRARTMTAARPAATAARARALDGLFRFIADPGVFVASRIRPVWTPGRWRTFRRFIAYMVAEVGRRRSPFLARLPPSRRRRAIQRGAHGGTLSEDRKNPAFATWGVHPMCGARPAAVGLGGGEGRSGLRVRP